MLINAFIPATPVVTTVIIAIVGTEAAYISIRIIERAAEAICLISEFVLSSRPL